MAFNLNDAPEQREAGVTIPDGTFVHLILNLRAGGSSIDGCEAADVSLFKPSSKSDAMMLDCEFTVMDGPFAHRKIFENLVVSGGSVDEKGQSKGWNMTKTRLRAMIDSACGFDPKDMSPAVAQQRIVPAFTMFAGITFWAKIGVEPGNEIMQNNVGTGRYYDPKNVIERIVVPGDAEYADLRAGKEVAAKPRHAASVPGAAATPTASSGAAKPAWGSGGAVASPAASPSLPFGKPAAPNAASPSTGGAFGSPTATQTAQVGAAVAASPSDGPAWLRQ